ncbi:MAG: aprE [Frankiales bacterium]|nr:aprE [Frankiales bacterium]
MRSFRLAAPAVLLVGLALAPTAKAAGRTQDVTWHGSQIHLYAAEAAGRDGAGVTVAVLDSWVDTTHPDFEGRARGAVSCVGGACKAGQTRDACTHGTHVAGTVGSSSFGVARKAIILPVQVLTADPKGECTGTPGDVAAGIRYAVAHGAEVLNLSLGPDVSLLGSGSAIPTAVHDAAAAGAVVVFSAGNAGDQTSQSYGSDALVVAATGPNGHLASYSQHGAGVSVAAPGGEPTSGDTCTQSICITSLYPGGQYAVAAGTSMAAPHVAGLAALLLGQTPGRSRTSVINRIEATAHPLAGAGSGLVDARAALGVRASGPAPTPSRQPAPVVRPHTSSPAPKPVTTTATPKKVVAPAPTASPTTAASVPTPLPTLVSAPVPATSPPAAKKTSSDTVPLPLAMVAGALIGLAGVGVLSTPRLLRR